jgi:hypothetical protein
MLGTVGAHTLGDTFELIGDCLLPAPRRPPQFLVDDAQIRHLGPNPFGLWIDARNALSRRRALDVTVVDDDFGWEPDT